MQKIVVIGDVHGTNTWELIVKQAEPDTTIVFVGDYFDAFDVSGDDQIKNFKKIVKLQKQRTSPVYLLIGNHELHYLEQFPNDRYSGYQRERAREISAIITPLVKKKKLIPAFQRGKYLITHAGVTKTWCEDHLGSGHTFSSKGISTLIAESFEENSGAFAFQPEDRSGYGNNIHQGPMWVRPEPLVRDALEGFVHVVGHTHVSMIEEADNAIFLDQGARTKEYLEINEDGTDHKIVPLI